ncbi:MAG: amino acid permease [Rhodothermales bacterium]
MGLLDVTMIGVGAMVGAGIFVLTGIAAGAAGPALILSFSLNGIITIFTAMVYAELGSAIPEAGGGYLWVKEGLPGPSAFLAGWMSWFAHAVAGSLYGLAFGSYLRLVMSEFDVSFFGIGTGVVERGLAILIILAFLYINYRGSSETGLIGNIVTLAKLTILLLFVASGMWILFKEPSTHFQHFEDFTPEGFPGILSAMGLTFIAFEGYEIIVQAGEETRDPRRTIPKAVFYSLAIVVPIYMLVAFVAIGAVDPPGGQATYVWLGANKELGLVEAARQFMPLGTVMLLIGGLFSTMSALNATTYSSTRVSFAMGRDRNLPDAFAAVHDRTKTPYKALLFTGALILFMAVVIPIQDVASAADIMFLLLFLMVNIAVISLRRQYGTRLRYGYMMPFFPIIPIIGIVTKLFLAVFMFNYSAIAWYFSLAWIGIGFGLYYFYARGHASEEERTPLVARLKQAAPFQTDKEYTVLVSIAKPESVETLIPPAVEAARRNDGSLVLLHVIHVPKQLPLSAARSRAQDWKSLIDKALEQVPQDIEAEAFIRIAHSPAQAIVDMAMETKADLLVMGWRGKPRDPKRLIGHNIDRIIQEVNGDVLVIQKIAETPFKRMLVPVDEPSEVAFALRAAQYAAGGNRSDIDVLHVFHPDVDDEVRETFMDDLRKTVDEFADEHGLDSEWVSLKQTANQSPFRAVIDGAEGYDALILDVASNYWRRKRRFFANRPVSIARNVECPVVLVHPKETVIGFSWHRFLLMLKGMLTTAEETGLDKAGMLKPEEEEKEEQELETGVSRLGVLAAGALAIGAAAMMYVGGGGEWTWIGSGGFLLGLFWFTWLSKRGVDRVYASEVRSPGSEVQVPAASERKAGDSPP